jgi:predicted MFS family arabinose efflux permease
MLLTDTRQAAIPVPWARVSAIAFSQLVAWGTLYYAFAVVIGPMGAETGWTKPQMNGALSVGLAISGLSAYFVGRWIDARGGRGLMISGALLGAISLVLWSRVTELWQLYAVWVLIGVASAMSLYEAAFAVTARMVPGNYRRAITLITLLGGLASTAFIPVTHWLCEWLGWRMALFVLALIELGICATTAWLVLPGRAAGNPATDAHIEPQAQGAMFARFAHHPVFWLLIVSYVAYAFFYTSLLFNLLPMLESMGFTAAAAIALYTLIGPSQVAGRLCVFALDRTISISLAGFAGTLLPVAAMLVLMTAQPDSSLALLFPLLFGAGMGIKTLVQATAAPEFLGEKRYGTLQGLIMFPVLVSQAAAPFIAASLWQITGSYGLLQSVLVGMTVISALAFALAAWQSKSRKHTANISDASHPA